MASIDVEVETKRRWWLRPAVFLCVLTRSERAFLPWLMLHGYSIRVSVGGKPVGKWQTGAQRGIKVGITNA